MCGVEDGVAGLRKAVVCREVLGEVGDVVLQNLEAQLGRALFYGGGEGLASPNAGDGRVAREEVLVDAGELVVGLAGAGDNETVYETFGDGLRYGVSQEVLHDHARRTAWVRVGIGAAQDIREGGLAKFTERCRRRPHGVCGESVDEFLELRRRVLEEMMFMGLDSN